LAALFWVSGWFSETDDISYHIIILTALNWNIWNGIKTDFNWYFKFPGFAYFFTLSTVKSNIILSYHNIHMGWFKNRLQLEPQVPKISLLFHPFLFNTPPIPYHPIHKNREKPP